MTPMTPRLRKLGLIAHISSSVGWLGAVAAFLVLGIAGLTSQDAEMVRGAYLSMNLIGRFVIVPLSLASVATGLVQALGTEWGLFRHTWIFVKLLLTVIATIVLFVKVPLMGFAARQALEANLTNADLRAAELQLVVHAAGGLLVLLAITTLSVVKPWGRTRYGRRKQQERHEGIQVMNTELDSDYEVTAAGLPILPKILLASFGVIIVLFVVLHLLRGPFTHHGH